MINKHNLAVAAFASKEVSRYTLNGILVTPDATVATDGCVLGWVSTPKESCENFPLIDGVARAAITDNFAPFILGLDDAKAIAKVLPRKTNIPVLQCAAIAVEETVTEGTGEITGANPAIAVTDLETPHVFRPERIAGQFPNYAAVMPTKKPVFQIAVDPQLLLAIAKAYSEFRKDDSVRSVRMTFYDAQSAIRFDAVNDGEQGMTCLLMPRGDDFAPIPHTCGWVAPVEVAEEPEPEPEPEPVASVAPVDADMDAEERGDASTGYVHVADDAIPPRGE